jgi:hypothetical protein
VQQERRRPVAAAVTAQQAVADLDLERFLGQR